ncbi:alpha/beta hydrolase [Sphingomonas sp.]|jgi:pimeloyl-ACP methyl ester carboxylesterase|uniref:alpha/beta fold hydrolase n=1 Tax=Sphingomonas sp. TaxID=28214 RepID=UPI002DF10180|nr:alpha/beta hydrolase [Sphingomonas sp.]
MRWLETLCLLLSALAGVGPALGATPAVEYANRVTAGPVQYREGSFGSSDERLHYVETGSGPLVILYHGFPSLWFSFFDQMEALKSRYRVVAVDGLGAGSSAKPEGEAPYRIDRLAAQLDRLARHLAGNERFVLIGHDWGAALGFAYAQAYPERLHAVVGLSAPPYNLFLDLVARDPEQQARSAYMQRFRSLTLASVSSGDIAERIARQSYAGLVESGALTGEEAELFRKALSDPRAIHGGMNWYRANIPSFEAITPQTRWPAANPKIKVPALLIWGDQDRTFVEQAWSRFGEYAERPTIVRLPGVGHWATMEKPQLANEAIETFLKMNIRSARPRHRRAPAPRHQ